MLQTLETLSVKVNQASGMGQTTSGSVQSSGGPMTGVAFGMVVFLGIWILIVFDPARGLREGWLSNILGFLIVVVLGIWNWHIEKESLKNLGLTKKIKQKRCQRDRTHYSQPYLDPGDRNRWYADFPERSLHTCRWCPRCNVSGNRYRHRY